MKRAVRIAAPFAALALLAIAPAVPAAPTMSQVLQATYSVRNLGDVDVAPDASAVAYHEAFRVAERTDVLRPRNRIYVQPVSGGAPVRVTAGRPDRDYNEVEPRWSPDGKRIAFLSDAGTPGQLQIYVCDARGRNPRRAGTFAGNVQSLRWSPDGTALSVLYIAEAHRQAGALAPGARDVGVIGSTTDEQRIATIDLASKHLRAISPADRYVYEYDWSPDGKHFAFTYAPGNGDENWWIAKLAAIGTDGSGMRDLLAPSYQIDDPRWSRDGKQIALIGGIMSDFGYTGGDVYLVDAATGSARDLTPAAKVSAQSLSWASAGRLDLVAHASGAMRLMQLDVASGDLKALTDKPESLSSLSIARDGATLALVRASWDVAPEIWAGKPESLVRVTSVNAGAPRLWGKAQSLTWKSDGYDVQGWLVYPLAYDPSKTYPMVMNVHGGPSGASEPGYGNFFVNALCSQGFFVFEPNPRGSYGAGEAFTAANVKDLGFGDWRDDLAGVDAAVGAASIDSRRLGLFGWSYGGYIGMWAETQTTRFKAIVAGAGWGNWQSYYGQNKTYRWIRPFFGASVYDDPAVYARSSPITYISHSHTPVLILQGERDEEVPAPQAFEFWQAMHILGVPTELVVYADEGHWPRKPVNQIDILTRTVGWFQRYLQSSTPL